ncbi:atp synthase (c ac39) subunit [Cystoisospora suis]|uniref:V-type proton ATPase subunit n=1 Tax=Cystoisospora suis TaxID=483139 RepID=A0A2C6LCX9_9APIC|nr:atp synthase (c ac39) subunit [Cystoisospora suis]
MQDEPLPLAVPTISQKCREKMADEFRHMRSQAYEPLGTFLDFIATEKMIDNVVGLIQGALNRKSAHELLARVDPMGYFQEMAAIANMDLTTSYEELYRALLIDTPVGKYFQAFLEESSAVAAAHGSADQGGRSLAEVASIVSETDIELMRNSLKKGWLEDFYAFSQSLGGTTKEVMTHILKTEADFRVLRLVVNSLSSNQQQQMDRQALYPSFGYLYPEGTDALRKAWNDNTVRAALSPFAKYLNLYEQCKAFYVRQDGETEPGTDLSTTGKFKSLEDLLYNETASMCELAFEQQFHYGIYYAWVKLKEQEIRNIVWIADMILMKKKEFITDQIVPLFPPRA